jgi:hypothetical protein
VTTPDHSITFALTAYGQWLVHRHGLAMRLQASLFPDHPVWSEQCFVLVRSDELGPAARDITTVRLEHPSAIRLLDRAIVLKSLATVLRFAYLADAPLRRVTWQPPPSAAGTPRLQATLFDSSILELREIAPGDAHGHVLMRQSGDPDRWFDTDRWSVLAPLLRQQRGAETASHQRRLPRALAALLHPLTAARLGGVPVLPPPAPRSGEIPTALPEREPHVARADTPAPLR